MFSLKFLRVLITLSFSLSLFGTPLYDLNGDWNNVNNPNGPWTAREGNNVLPFINSWLPGSFEGEQQSRAVVASGAGHTPTWFKSSVPYLGVVDFQPGDVVVHSAPPFMGITNMLWTSPMAGVADVNLGLWLARSIGRSNHFAFYLNDALLTEGDLFDGDAFDRANPFHYSNSLNLSQGDVLRLDVIKTSVFAEFTGVNWSVDFPNIHVEVPEPSSWIIGASGLLAFLMYARRRRLS